MDGLSIPRLVVLTAGIWGGVAGVAWAGTAPVEPSTSRALAGPATVATGTGIPYVVVAAFHWGVERASGPSGRQRALAGAALAGGTAAVIGSHPHMLQPTVRRGRRGRRGRRAR